MLSFSSNRSTQPDIDRRIFFYHHLSLLKHRNVSKGTRLVVVGGSCIKIIIDIFPTITSPEPRRDSLSGGGNEEKMIQKSRLQTTQTTELIPTQWE